MDYVIILLIVIILLQYNITQKNSLIRKNSYVVSNDLFITDSPIQGKGIFTKSNIQANVYLFVGLVDGTVTPIGGMINHCSSNKKNCNLVKRGNKYIIHSSKFIPAGFELIMDYNKTPSFIKKPDPSWVC